MQGIKVFITLSLTLNLLLAVSPAHSTSQAECAIWLCLPSGFTTGCSAAKSAFKKRIKKGKSPLPNFNHCAVPGSTENISYKRQKAAKILEHRKCTEWDNENRCEAWELIPTHIIKNDSCDEDQPHCVNLRYIDIYVDGKKTGESYFY